MQIRMFYDSTLKIENWQKQMKQYREIGKYTANGILHGKIDEE